MENVGSILSDSWDLLLRQTFVAGQNCPELRNITFDLSICGYCLVTSGPVSSEC